MDHSGVKQNTLSEGRFAGINVRSNPDVTRLFERVSAVRRIWIG
jgi:hypothetical protein